MKKPPLTNPQIIPSLDYGGNSASLHFAHANGYPPGAYRQLLDALSVHYHVVAMHQRPLWRNSHPQELSDWRPMADDLDRFLTQENLPSVIGVGHSLGANNTLRLALAKPQRFSALVLLDPVIFHPWMSIAWKLIMKLGLGMKIHPLAASTLRRRRSFPDQKSMFEHYRTKPVFERIPDESLRAYVESVARSAPGGGVELAYSPEWETQIYLTGSLSDLALWRELKNLSQPTLIIRGQLTNTFSESIAQRIKRLVPHVQIDTMPETGHLLPLEKPQAVAKTILEFLGTKSG